jgi:CheY-like chemotaxis protein
LFFTEQQKRIGKQHINFRLEFNDTKTCPIIQTDKIKLKQILINLIGNAFKFTENGSIKCGCKQDNDQLVFYVSDTGIGIPRDKHDVVFERFSQVSNTSIKNASGTGLGLAIAKGLSGLLGGNIWLESEPENLSAGKVGGTTFFFSVQYNKSGPSVHLPTTNGISKEIDHSKKTILIVDGDIFNSKYLKEILEKVPYNIITTEYGKEAVQIAISQPVDLILMDIGTTDMDGYETTKKIKQFKPQMKIIAQTEYVAEDERLKAIGSGCIDYICKPVKRELLMLLINKHLN